MGVKLIGSKKSIYPKILDFLHTLSEATLCERPSYMRGLCVYKRGGELCTSHKYEVMSFS